MSRKITQTFYDAIILESILEHNGEKGGDAGHGGFVSVCLKTHSNFVMVNEQWKNELSFTVAGDAERRVLIEAFKMIVDELEKHPLV